MSKTDSTPKPKTIDRILDQAITVAEEGGLEAVTHKGIAGDLGLSSSNVLYYFPTALHLRRAVALKLIERLGRPSWGVIEFWVTRQLPETHRAAFDDGEPHPTDDEMQEEQLVAECFLWLARNGIEDPEPAE